MKNIFFLLLALVFFGVAFYVYWIVAQENATAAVETTRSIARQGPRQTSDVMRFINEWQPYLSVASSLGGIASFMFQLRIWMRGRN